MTAATGRTCILVLGMHRSGTSATAGLLAELGVTLPKDAIPADQNNEAGYFEPASIVAVNDRILAEAGSRPDDWRPLALDRLGQERLDAYRAEIRQCLCGSFEGASVFAIKDPRICRMVPFYSDLLASDGIAVHYLLVLRDPAAVAASLTRRDGTTPGFAYLLWLRHMLDAERATRGRRRAFVSYDAALDHPAAAIATIAKWLDLQGTPKGSGIFRADLRHHDSRLEEESQTELLQLVRTAYGALLGFAGGESSAHRDALDRVRSRLNAICSTTGDPIFEEIAERERRAHLSQQYFEDLAARRNDEMVRLEALAEERRVEITRLGAVTQRRSADIVQLSAIVEERNAEIAKLSAIADERQKTIASLTEAKARVEQNLQRANTELSKAAAEAAERTAHIEALEDAVQRGERAALDLGEGLAAAEAKVARLRRELELAEARAEEMRLERDVAAGEVRRIFSGRSYRAAQMLSRAYQVSPLIRRLARVAEALPRRSAPHRQPTDEATRDAVLRSGLFDADDYRRRYADSMSLPDPLDDFLSSAPGTRDPSPLFSAQHYLGIHRDVAAAGLNPLVHFVRYGMNEGRVAFSQSRIKQFLATSSDFPVLPLRTILDPSQPVTVLVADDGNFFFRDIATYVRSLLSELGYDAEVEPDVPLERAASTPLVVAPHEFFLTDAGKHWSEEQITSAAYVNTEQWQTPWFARCFRHLMRTRIGVLDINPNSAASLARLGRRAAFLPLLPLVGSAFEQTRTPLSAELTRRKHLPALTYPERIDDRPIDIAFVAVLNERRARGLAMLAPILAGAKCFIHAPRFDRPILASDPDVLGNADFAQIARNSKILLNIHRDDVGYLEWHRIFLYGIMNGCVVVTEPCFRNAYIRPGTHYLEVPLAEMPRLLDELLTSAHGQDTLARIAANNHQLAARIAEGERFL